MRANQIILMFTCVLLLCSTMNAQETVTVTDIDGNVYQTVKIGDQWWMAENLKTTQYNNDTAIDYPGTDTTVWQSDTTGAYAWYNNDESNKEVYGALYNWHAVNTGNLCPVGWHVPTDEEWMALVDYLGVSTVAGGKMKTTGTIKAGDGLWRAPNTGATNESDFSGLPGGFANYYGDFYFIGSAGYWWSSTEYCPYFAFFHSLGLYSSDVLRYVTSKQNGYSVRCVRDE